MRIVKVQVRTWTVEIRQDRRRARVASVLLDLLLQLVQRVAGRWGTVDEEATKSVEA